MSETEALEGLRRSEEKLRAYGAEHGLVLREESPWPGYVPAAQQPGPVKHAVWSLAGVLPGGAIGRLRHQAIFGSTFGMDVAGQHTLMICRIPESVGYVPYLGCRPDTIGGAMYAWDNDNRPKQSQVFESVELERRYKVEVAAGQAQNWIYQLLPPPASSTGSRTRRRSISASKPSTWGLPPRDAELARQRIDERRGRAGAARDVLLENGSRVAS